MAVRILIVDDEPPARTAIAGLLKANPAVQIVGEAADGSAAIEAIRGLRPDLVFLDIQMPSLTGLQVLEALEPAERPAVVFVTAYDRHALRAFELSAVDYLLKPFSDERFTEALGRATRRLHHESLAEMQARLTSFLKIAPGAASARISLKVGGDYCLLALKDIQWVEAQGDVLKVAAEGQIFRPRETLQDFRERLTSRDFLQVHRSYLVNLNQVRKVTVSGGQTLLVMSDGAKVPVGRTYRDRLAAAMPGPIEG